MPERYEAITIVIKVPENGERPSDALHDWLTKDCQGEYCRCDCHSDYDSEDPEAACCDGPNKEMCLAAEKPCTCGMESMGATIGTLEECYRYLYPDWDDEEDFRELTIDEEEG